jgi:DNA-binding XRE family transcriptional regulator
MPNKLKVAASMVGVRQAEIADEVEIAPSNLSDIFNGKYVDLQFETTRKFAEFFACPVEILFPKRAA